MSDTWTLQDEAASPYLQICKIAAQSSDAFNTFKSHGAYRHVLEHVAMEEGQPRTGYACKAQAPSLQFSGQPFFEPFGVPTGDAP